MLCAALNISIIACYFQEKCLSLPSHYVKQEIMTRKLYPIGIQTFERIRKEDKFYVDKTEYIYHMTHTDGKYFDSYRKYGCLYRCPRR